MKEYKKLIIEVYYGSKDSIIDDIDYIRLNDNIVEIHYSNAEHGEDIEEINIHELAHKCKEWGLSQFKDCLFSINEFSSFDNVRIEVVKYTDNKVEEKKFNFKLSRPENMIECCQWILENNKDK